MIQRHGHDSIICAVKESFFSCQLIHLTTLSHILVRNLLVTKVVFRQAFQATAQSVLVHIRGHHQSVIVILKPVAQELVHDGLFVVRILNDQVSVVTHSLEQFTNCFLWHTVVNVSVSVVDVHRLLTIEAVCERETGQLCTELVDEAFAALTVLVEPVFRLGRCRGLNVKAHHGVIRFDEIGETFEHRIVIASAD